MRKVAGFCFVFASLGLGYLMAGEPLAFEHPELYPSERESIIALNREANDLEAAEKKVREGMADVQKRFAAVLDEAKARRKLAASDVLTIDPAKGVFILTAPVAPVHTGAK